MKIETKTFNLKTRQVNESSLIVCLVLKIVGFIANAANYTRELARRQIFLKHSQDQSNLVVFVFDCFLKLLNVLPLVQSRAVGRDHVLEALDLLFVRAALDPLLNVFYLLKCLRMVFVELIFRLSWACTLAEGVGRAHVVRCHRFD